MIKFYYFGTSEKSKRVKEGKKGRREGGKKEGKMTLSGCSGVSFLLSPKTDSQYTLQVTSDPRRMKGEESFGFHHRLAPYSL